MEIFFAVRINFLLQPQTCQTGGSAFVFILKDGATTTLAIPTGPTYGEPAQ